MRTLLKHLILAVSCLSVVACGQIERTWTIKSEPSGALVEVSGVEIGRTPATIDFLHYGTYEVVLRKDGYETLIKKVELNPPWYQKMGVDFFTEVFVPKKFVDKRETLHVMKRKLKADADEVARLKNRAKRMRNETVTGEQIDVPVKPVAPSDRINLKKPGQEDKQKPGVTPYK